MPQYEYLWADGLKVKKPVRLAAPEYINALFDWIEAQVQPRMGSSYAPWGTSLVIILRKALSVSGRAYVMAHVRLSQAASPRKVPRIHVFVSQQADSYSGQPHQALSCCCYQATLVLTATYPMSAHVLRMHMSPCPGLAPQAPRCAQMDDPRMFPQQYGEPFPPDFRAVVRTVFKRLFRVYAHLYHSHFRHVCSLGEEAHLNTCFKHFVYFTQARPPRPLPGSGRGTGCRGHRHDEGKCIVVLQWQVGPCVCARCALQDRVCQMMGQDMLGAGPEHPICKYKNRLLGTALPKRRHLRAMRSHTVLCAAGVRPDRHQGAGAPAGADAEVHLMQRGRTCGTRLVHCLGQGCSVLLTLQTASAHTASTDSCVKVLG